MGCLLPFLLNAFFDYSTKNMNCLLNIYINFKKELHCFYISANKHREVIIEGGLEVRST